MLHTTTQLAETKDKFDFLEIVLKPEAVPPAGLCLLLTWEDWLINDIKSDKLNPSDQFSFKYWKSDYLLDQNQEIPSIGFIREEDIFWCSFFE